MSPAFLQARAILRKEAQMDAVVGVFASREAGERAIYGLGELGFTKDRIRAREQSRRAA